jgi:CheY-like chemotaxis protein
MKKVLIVEDDPRIAQVTKISLEMMTKWEILTAKSGYEGLKIAEKCQPDLIVLDMMMPDLSGEETIKELKKHPKTKDILIVLLTAKSNISNSWQKWGVQGMIKKPYDSITLADEIQKIVNW